MQSPQKIALLTLGGVALGVGIVVAAFWPSGSDDLPEIAGFVYPQPKPVAPFELVDHEGSPVDVSTLKGKWSFVYFGYTHCPDVCPLTLAELSRVQRLLAEAGLDRDNQYLFVSVDPARDTPELLANYVTHFNKSFVGVTGSERMLEKFTHDVGVLYEFPGGEDGRDYDVIHSSTLTLFDPGARLHAVFTSPHEAEKIAEGFREIRQQWQPS